MPVRRMASLVVTFGSPVASSSATLAPDDAAKADVAGGGIDRLGVARSRPVAATVVRRAQVGAALQYLARNADVGLAGIVAAFLGRPTRILGRAARARHGRLVARRPPVRGPLPDVADHVVQAVAIGRISGDRRRARVAVLAGVLRGEIPLPGV